MKLIELIKNIEVKETQGDTSINIEGIAYDSSKVQPGFAFVAVRGEHTDGHKFIADAVRKGANTIICEDAFEVGPGVARVIVKDSRLALALISSNYFNDPSAKMRVFGITGTNGKTTISYLVEAVLKEAGRMPGIIGTISWRYDDVSLPAPNTTPMSFDLQMLLARMRDAGVTDVVMEVSSHALDQDRVAGVHFDSVIFTNLTHDHLDYHKDVEEYFRAKQRLFSEFLPDSVKTKKNMAINFDDEYGKKIAPLKLDNQTVKAFYGFDNGADVTVTKLHSSIEGNKLDIQTPWGRLNIESSLRGRFNAFNVMAAVASLGSAGIPLETIKRGIEGLKNVPGRLEDIPNGRGVHVFVDYAHTPDALKNVLETLREVTNGRLITVFGCGGDRDKTKRAIMGEFAARLSDVAIVTSDNPRTEDAAKIIEEIMPGVTPHAKEFIVEPDREKAIRNAIAKAKKGDVILIAGKGHENYQIVGKEVRHFDDREVARKYLNA